MTVRFSAPYKTRPIRFLELWEWNGWRLKVYGISAVSERPTADLITTAKGLAKLRLPKPAQGRKRYGLGYLIVHEGENADYVFVDWWFDGDIVQHHLYGARKGHGGKLRYRWPRGAGFCVSELAVCWHEREAWIKHVLANPDEPDVDRYLADRMNGEA